MLNALRVDPGRPWLSPASGQETVWRWFGDAMLDCCKRHMLRSLSLNHATEAEEALFATNTDTLDCEARAVLTLACPACDDSWRTGTEKGRDRREPTPELAASIRSGAPPPAPWDVRCLRWWV